MMSKQAIRHTYGVYGLQANLGNKNDLQEWNSFTRIILQSKNDFKNNWFNIKISNPKNASYFRAQFFYLE